MQSVSEQRQPVILVHSILLMNEMTIEALDMHKLRRSCANCALHQLCLPAGIDGKEMNQLDEVVRARRPFARGDGLFHAGAQMTSLFVVRSGSFKSFVDSEGGSSQVLGFHLPGEIVGLDALSDDLHKCNAEALERSSVCEIPTTHLLQVAAQLPSLQRQLLRLASREIGKDHEHLVMMGRKQAQERIAIFLRSISERYQRLGMNGDEFTLTMSRYDIANYLGLVVETVSRLFTRFMQDGVLDVRRKQIRILDQAALVRLTNDEMLRSAVKAS